MFGINTAFAGGGDDKACRLCSSACVHATGSLQACVVAATELYMSAFCGVCGFAHAYYDVVML